jgi:hypothetical protein
MKKNLRKHKNLKFLRKALPKIFFMVIIGAANSPGFSQQIGSSLLCSGGEAFVAANQSIEFAIGEIATETWHSGANTITQGFFQGTADNANNIEDFIKSANIRIYPNPARSQLTVKCDIAPEYIRIIDMQGRELLSFQNPQQIQTLDIENLVRGIYILRIVFEGNIQTSKQIVKN